MFSLRYYNEGSIFQWMMLFLILTIIFGVADVGGFLTKDNRVRILAAIVLIVIVITPIGSNNYTYANMNNLFIAAPYTFWAAWRLWQKTRGQVFHFPWQAFMITILAMTLIQGIGFGLTYVFKDGINGEKRDAQVEGSAVLQGMYTTKENADNLTSLIAYMKKEDMVKEPILIWGDAPGLSYILDVPSAIFTTWPEAPSNTSKALDTALTALDYEPVILWHNDGSGYDDAAHELSEAEITLGKKKDLIADFIASHNYECVYENDFYKVFQASKE